MTSKSEAVVNFIASLMPLYVDEQHDGMWCARSMQDGTLILPADESDFEEETGMVRVRWQGDLQREQLVDGTFIASLALERYVRLHGAGFDEESIGNELWYMARHFHFKTGCSVSLSNLHEPAHPLVKAGTVARRMGEGLLVNLFGKITGIG